jgi:sec-independent protein translocase protein TatA
MLKESSMEIGIPELIVVLLIVVFVFGIGRVGQIGGELGSAIRQFREGVKDNSPDSAPAASPTAEQKG